MHLRKPLALLAMLALASCAPKMGANRIALRAVSVTNLDTSAFVITRMIANDRPDDASCVAFPKATLQPGESQTVPFLMCGNITAARVETDRGTTTFDWKS